MKGPAGALYRHSLLEIHERALGTFGTHNNNHYYIFEKKEAIELEKDPVNTTVIVTLSYVPHVHTYVSVSVEGKGQLWVLPQSSKGQGP
jgi:hypothetical protein